MSDTSPFAPDSYPTLHAINGVRIASMASGVRYQGRKDLLIAELAENTSVAGVFTQSLTASAPVLACRKALVSGMARILVVNSGNSNAFTGSAGEHAVNEVQKTACNICKCDTNHFFMASTGVIGEPLPYEKITQALPDLHSALSDEGWDDAAHAIMTTDTYRKMSTRSVTIGKTKVTLNGIAKGSGMIAPDMATMLAFIFTDAAIPSSILQALLDQTNDKSFNCITVDGDTSTSDTVLLFATGKAKNDVPSSVDDPLLTEFTRTLQEIMHELAQHIVKDGEGAEKLVTIRVTGAATDEAAKKIGLSIANSPLVKTALAASDANWGRIVMAVGKAGEQADRDKLRINIGGITVAKDGQVDPDYREEQIDAHMKSRDILIEVDVGIASGQSEIWTCDLTHRYIDINAGYRT